MRYWLNSQNFNLNQHLVYDLVTAVTGLTPFISLYCFYRIMYLSFNLLDWSLTSIDYCSKIWVVFLTLPFLEFASILRLMFRSIEFLGLRSTYFVKFSLFLDWGKH